MNWKQLFACATPQEHLEALLLMLRTIDARRRRPLSPRERAGVRVPRGKGRGGLIFASFTYIIITMSIGLWISIFHLPPNLAAPLMLIYLTSLFAILLVKPPRRRLFSSPKMRSFTLPFGGG